MHGVGESSGAITIVNALASGVGAAVGIELFAHAEVDLHPAGSTDKWDVQIEEPTRTPLVVASLTEALRKFAPGSSGTAELSVRSDIPVARGLKSSSAVSSAIVLAVAHAVDAEVTSIEVARLSAQVAVASGLSATGAFDDALAGMSRGIVVTDNRRGELLQTFPMPPHLGAALLLPGGTHRPSPEWAAAFQAESVAGDVARDAALRGDWTVAMRENTELVERVMRYDYRALRTRVLQRGAVACGVSGMGPTLAAVGPRESLDSIIAAFPSSAEGRRTVEFSSGASRGGDTRK
jgi:shikimate kinase